MWLKSGTALSAIPSCKIHSMRAIFAGLLRFVMEARRFQASPFLMSLRAVRSWGMFDSLSIHNESTLLEIRALYSFDSQCKLKAFIFDSSAEV